jgi:hypothetical protein
MRRKSLVYLLLVGIAAVLAAGCGSSSVTGADSPVGGGAAVLQGGVVGAGLGLGSSAATSPVHALAGGSGWTVTVVGTSLSAEVDDDGRFVLSGVPAGSVSLRIEGPGVSAQVSVSGLVDGQVTSIEVRISGGSAQLTAPPACAPSAETFFSGTLDAIAGNRLVVAGRSVDTSQLQKVWRGERRIQLSELVVGEKVKVWGQLRGDGVVVADEIAALTSDGGETWVTFTGKVESIGAKSLSLHGNPNTGTPSTGGYPTLVVKGITVRTGTETKVKRSDGSPMQPGEIQVGQTASVEGWKKSDGSVRATLIVIDGAGSGTSASWVSFKGRVDSVGFTSLSLHADPNVSYPTLLIAGYKVKTDGGTTFKWSNGTGLDPAQIRAGDQAYVEGWSKPEGYVLAVKLVVDAR